MTSGLVGGIVTTVLIVIFGEIIPQSVCSRYALRVGAASMPVVYCFVVLMFVFAYPISLLLDYLLGGEVSAVYTKSELQSLIRLNIEDETHAKESGLTRQDGKILHGALTFRDKKVHQVMTPLDATFMLPMDATLDLETIEILLSKGHTRMPIFKESPRDVVAVLYCKDIVGLGYERCTPLREVVECFSAEKRVVRAAKDTNLGTVFDMMKESRIHLLIITESHKPKSPAVGIVSMEDILEEILQEELVGDDDLVVDAAASSKMNIRKVERNKRRYDPSLMIKVSQQGNGDGWLVRIFSLSAVRIIFNYSSIQWDR